MILLVNKSHLEHTIPLDFASISKGIALAYAGKVHTNIISYQSMERIYGERLCIEKISVWRELL